MDELEAYKRALTRIAALTYRDTPGSLAAIAIGVLKEWERLPKEGADEEWEKLPEAPE